MTALWDGPVRGSGLRPLRGRWPEGPAAPLRQGAWPERILVVGTPRSSTSWVAEVLAKAPGAQLVYEPDNPDVDPWAPAAVGSANLALPVLAPGDRAPVYDRLWQLAFAGRPGFRTEDRVSTALKPVVENSAWRARTRSVHVVGPLLWRARVWRTAAVTRPATVIAKSVHAALAVEWIADRWQPRVVVVHRHPLAIVASWLRMGFAPRPRPGDPRLEEVISRLGLPALPSRATPAQRVGWGVGVQIAALNEAAARHPEWVVLKHDELLSDALSCYRQAYARLGLQWTEAVGEGLLKSNAPGEGYQTSRVWTDLTRRVISELGHEEEAAARSVLEAFPGGLL